MREIRTLNNGIRVAVESVSYVNSVSLGFWVGAGSRSESDQNNGVAHFIEHMLFKGTKNRSARDIVEQVEERGGHLNAFTSREHTCYYVKALAEDFGFVLEILTDMLRNSLFDPEDILKEKNVVLEEINMYEDTPDELVHDLQLAGLYRDHPLGRSILGTERSIGALTRQDILNFIEKHYTAGNLVVSVAGNVEPEEVFPLVEEFLGDLPAGIGGGTDTVPAPGPGFHFFPKKTEQINFCLGRGGFDRSDPDYYRLVLLNNMVGGSASSRMFQEIREKRGLVYSTYSYHSTFTGGGTFTAYGGTSLVSFGEVLRLTAGIFQDIRENGFGAEEMERNQSQIRAQLLMSSETVSSKMKKLGGNLISYDRVIDEEEMIRELGVITLPEMNRFARDFLRLEDYCLTFIGPRGEDGEYLSLWKELGGAQ